MDDASLFPLKFHLDCSRCHSCNCPFFLLCYQYCPLCDHSPLHLQYSSTSRFNKTQRNSSLLTFFLQLLSHFSAPPQGKSWKSCHIHCLHFLTHILPSTHSNGASATVTSPSRSPMTSILPNRIISLSLRELISQQHVTLLTTPS